VTCCLKVTCYKTATYALMHFVVAIGVAYVLTGSWQMALAIGLVEPFVQTFAFAFHERAWSRALARNELDPVEGTAATPLRGPGVGAAAGSGVFASPSRQKGRDCHSR
jgi:uncharacterized membrane protein